MAATLPTIAATGPENARRVESFLSELRDLLLAARNWNVTTEPVPPFGPDDPPTLYVEFRIEPFR